MKWSNEMSSTESEGTIAAFFSSSAVNHLCNRGQINPSLWFSVLTVWDGGGEGGPLSQLPGNCTEISAFQHSVQFRHVFFESTQKFIF